MLKLRLKNYRCYTDKYFEFQNGISLISGNSGKGKSTILSAINYALFGKERKVCTNGATICQVELTYGDMKIVRTNRPSRLLINDTIEDDEAQELINKKFGDTFDISAYISQNSMNSFIMLSPIEKLSFIEKFAFRDINLIKLKNNCKSYISKMNDELTMIISKIDLTNKLIENFNKPEQVKFPLKHNSKSDKAKLIKNQEILFRNTEKQIKKINSEITATNELLNNTVINNIHLSNKLGSLEEINKKINKLTLSISAIGYKGDEFLEEQEQLLGIYIKQKELVQLQEKIQTDTNKLNEIIELETSEIKAELSKISETLWNECTEQEATEIISDYEETVNDLNNIKKYRKELSKIGDISIETLKELQNTLETNQKILDKNISRKKVYVCPSCKNNLHFDDCKTKLILGNQQEYDEKIDIAKIESIVKSLQTEISRIQSMLNKKENLETQLNQIISKYEQEPSDDDTKEGLEFYRNYIFTNKQQQQHHQELTTKLKTGKFSNTCSNLKLSVAKLTARLQSLQQDCTVDLTDINEEELRELIANQKQLKYQLSVYNDQLKALNVDKNVLEKEINTLELLIKEKYFVDQDKLKENINNLQIELTNKEKEKEEYSSNLEKINKWKQYNELIEQYDKLQKELTELQEKEKTQKMRYSSAMTLKECILQAESISIISIINSINLHAQIYLDEFFQDNPISVNLSSFKQTKKDTKPQINVEIEYKGMEFELNMLSGGEISRIILAYTIALAEIFNSPILMLDEITANLDQENINYVFDAIKDNFKDRIMLVVAHQVTEGYFDNVIKV